MIFGKSLILFVFFFFHVSAEGKNYLDNQEFMNLKTAIQHYGTASFSVGKFKDAPSEVKAKMAVSLIKNNAYLGKTPDQIRKELGDFTGHFFSDRIPAYLIEEGWTKGKNTWQLVFLLDNSGKVSEIKIHKNCCTKAGR